MKGSSSVSTATALPINTFRLLKYVFELIVCCKYYQLLILTHDNEYAYTGNCYTCRKFAELISARADIGYWPFLEKTVIDSGQKYQT